MAASSLPVRPRRNQRQFEGTEQRDASLIREAGAGGHVSGILQRQEARILPGDSLRPVHPPSHASSRSASQCSDVASHFRNASQASARHLALVALDGESQIAVLHLIPQRNRVWLHHRGGCTPSFELGLSFSDHTRMSRRTPREPAIRSASDASGGGSGNPYSRWTESRPSSRAERASSEMASPVRARGASHERPPCGLG